MYSPRAFRGVAFVIRTEREVPGSTLMHDAHGEAVGGNRCCRVMMRAEHQALSPKRCIAFGGCLGARRFRAERLPTLFHQRVIKFAGFLCRFIFAGRSEGKRSPLAAMLELYRPTSDPREMALISVTVLEKTAAPIGHIRLSW